MPSVAETPRDAALRIRTSTVDEALPDGRMSRSFLAGDVPDHWGNPLDRKSGDMELADLHGAGAGGVKATVSSRTSIMDPPAAPMPLGKKVRVAMVAVFSALGSSLFGLDIGYIGPILEDDGFKRDCLHTNVHHHVDPNMEGLIVSLFSIGAMSTAFPFVSSYFMDEWGRKAAIALGSFIFIIGSVIQAASTSSAVLLVGRFVAGMSIGLLSSVIVLYQSEVAPASMRGALSTLYQLGITFGILVAAFIDQMILPYKEGWRIVMVVITAPGILLIAGMFCMPQSPRWLVAKGRDQEALEILYTIRSEAEAVQEHLEIQLEVKRAFEEGEPAWIELLRGRVFQLVCLGVLLQILQQLVGMNAFMYFGPKIFESLDFGKNLFTTINNLINFLSTFPAVLLADLAGRRTLMLWSSIGMTLSCMIMGILGVIFVRPDGKGGFRVTNAAAGWVIAIAVFFFVFNFAYGFGPIVWVYCAEIFPLRYSARGVGVCTLANWVGNFCIAQFTPVMLSGIGFGTFFVFGSFAFIGCCISFWMPETKEVPLELIQQLFDNRIWFCKTANQIKEEVPADGIPRRRAVGGH